MEKIKIINALIVVSLIVLVIFLLWFMFGSSPTFEQIVILFVMPFAAALFGIYERLNNRITHTREMLQQELGKMKETLGRIEGRLSKK